MNSYESAYGRRLKARLNEQYVELGKQLAQGSAQSFDDYRYRVGYLRALEHVVEEICPAIEAELMGYEETKEDK